jgi:hypothetical protein
MAASDQLMALANRAKAAEDRVAAAAKTQNRAEVEKQVNKARSAAQKKADGLQAQNAKVAAGASQWWTDVQASWSTHVAQVHDDIETRKADRDSKKAQHRADRAEDDAISAVAFAEAALEEAEYAVLDAQLARLEAESTAM